MMKAALACLLFICLPFPGRCSDANQEQKAREDDVLTGLFGSKVGVYLRMAALRTACGRIAWLDQQAQGAWPRYRVSQRNARLQKPCRLLHLTAREDHAGPRHAEKKSYDKRKSPNVPRRQFHANAPRKPYLLKRSGSV